jgi:AraC-like DNA-binding protein
VLLYIRFYQFPADIKRILYLENNFFSGIEIDIATIVQNIQVIAYSATALVLVHFYKRQVKNQQASVHTNQFAWLNIVVYGFLFLNYASFFKHILYSQFGIYSELLLTLRYIGLLVFALIILYHSLNHPALFSVIDFNLNGLQKSSLSNTVFQDYKSTLKKYMENKKPYLEPDISLNKLSDLVSIPPRSLSEVINKGFKMNFFEFVNYYRINDAKQIIEEHKENNKTILEILYEVGFNNKSVFNSVFKKQTGKTPTQYKSDLAG